ncbi:MAG: ankyrin repeat domain-containing protein [Pseudomonadota bacterium]|nr:ankyrin repeat domain-containing protein [Pseudomonadota bacterium]
MTSAPRRRLPAHPSKEHLRKQAKRQAKSDGVALAAAQRRLAAEYGFDNWSALMRAVDEARSVAQKRSPLFVAAAGADEAAVRRLLAEGAPADGDPHEVETPLFRACDSAAPAEKRLAVVKMLLDAGAFVRRGCAEGATPLHAAARRGPAALVELLLRSGALVWQGDEKGLRPYDYARDGSPAERERILYLCSDDPKIEDGSFRAAVAAIQTGDLPALRRLLDEHPHLLHMRAIEPDIGPRGYFSDPKLFWFIANNPTLVPAAPANIVAVAEEMIRRGVERSDLDYALELVMTNGMMAAEQQLALVETLIGAGAMASSQAILMTLGHRQTAPVAWLLDHGEPLSAPIAAALGKDGDLAALLAQASQDEKNAALAMAVINRQREAVRLCLEAGAEPNRFMPCHSHSTPLHQAALDGDLPIMEMLIAHGARLDIEDTMWRGTPLGWAAHGGQGEAERYLRGIIGA